MEEIKIYFIKVFSRQIYLYGFHIFKLKNLYVIHDLYSQYLIQILSKTTFFTGMEGSEYVFPLHSED